MKRFKQIAIFLICLILGTSFQGLQPAKASSGDYGVATFVSSLPSNSNKSTVVSLTKGAGFGWAREEYTYSSSIDFAPYDAAYSKIHGSGLKILGLLTYQEGVSHSDWKNYVKSVVGHFPGVSAWEIMNEADNYLSASDYTVYLKEANAIIKSKGNATVVLTGLTARKEVYPFWDGVKVAGGWDSFDVLGLHMFHDGVPTEDSFNNGTLSQEVQKVVNSINKNGGGKRIWVTELGYDSNNYGLTNQANWLVQSLGIVHGFSEVEKIFVFRLYDHGNGLGLVTSGFKQKESYGAVKNYLSGAAPAPAPAPTPKPTVSAAPVSVVSPTESATPTPTITKTPEISPSPSISPVLIVAPAPITSAPATVLTRALGILNKVKLMTWYLIGGGSILILTGLFAFLRFFLRPKVLKKP